MAPKPPDARRAPGNPGRASRDSGRLFNRASSATEGFYLPASLATTGAKVCM